MAQTAHDFTLFENTTTPRTASAKARPALRAVKGGAAAQPGRLQALWGNLRTLLSAVLFLGLAICLLRSKATITELTTQIQREQTQLVAEQSTYNYLNSELNSRTSMANVEEVANRLGLMKLDDSQITYVRLEESSTLTRAASQVEQWSEFLYSGLLSLMDKLEF